MAAPNILFILIDCLRADRALPGGGAQVPTIDRLAGEGVRFTQMITAATYTGPSMASMFTGLFPFRHGVRSNRTPLDPAHGTLAQWLAGAGYHTVGIKHGALVGEIGLARGFEEFHDRPRTEGLSGEWGLALRERIRSRSIPEPWFLYLHLWELHWPRHVPEAFDSSRYGDTLYDRALSAVDAELAPIVDVLPPGTVTVLTGDHGEHVGTASDDVRPSRRALDSVLNRAWRFYKKRFQGRLSPTVRRRLNVPRKLGLALQFHGFDVSEELVRVPFVMSGGDLPRGRTVTSQVRTIDIPPTLLDVAGVARPAQLEEPLTALIAGGTGPDRPAYAEASVGLGSPPETWWSCLREDGFKYVMRPYAPERPGRLHHLESDPAERDDASAAHPERAAAMRSRLIEMLEGTEGGGTSGMSEEEERAVTQRLAELGYLEA